MNHLKIIKHILCLVTLVTFMGGCNAEEPSLVPTLTSLPPTNTSTPPTNTPVPPKPSPTVSRIEKLRPFYETIELADEALLAADGLDALAVLGETGGYEEAFEVVQRLKAALEGLDVPDDPEAQALYNAMMKYINIDLKWLEAGGYSVKMNPHLMSKTNALGEKNEQLNAFRESINIE